MNILEELKNIKDVVKNHIFIFANMIRRHTTDGSHYMGKYFNNADETGAKMDI